MEPTGEDIKPIISLGEIIVIVIILLIAGAIILPAMIPGGHGPRRESRCLTQLQDIGKSLMLYASSHGKGKYYPYYAPRDPQIYKREPAEDGSDYRNDGNFGAQSLWLLVNANLAQPKSFICPYTKDDASLVNATTSFDNSVSGRQCSYGYDPRHTNNDQPAVAIMSDKPYYEGGALYGEQGYVSHNHGINENDPDGDGESMHVLYVGNNVVKEMTPYCGYLMSKTPDSKDKPDDIFSSYNKETRRGRGGTDSFIIR